MAVQDLTANLEPPAKTAALAATDETVMMASVDIKETRVTLVIKALPVFLAFEAKRANRAMLVHRGPAALKVFQACTAKLAPTARMVRR